MYNVCNTTFNVNRSGCNSCGQPCSYNRCGCNACGNGENFINTLFGNTRQTVCRDCCGNLRITSDCGCNTCGCNQARNCGGCGGWGAWSTGNTTYGNACAYNGGNTYQTGNNGTTFSCITRCRTTDNGATATDNGACGCNCGYNN